MNRFKVAFLILLIVTLAFIGFIIYCFDRAIVHAPERPEGYVDENGLWHDPSLAVIREYNEKMESLKPYRLFFWYSPIGIILLFGSWLLLGYLWMKREKNDLRRRIQ